MFLYESKGYFKDEKKRFLIDLWICGKLIKNFCLNFLY